MSLYFNALQLCKAPDDNKQIAYLYGEIGYAYLSQEHFAEAENYYNKALVLLRQLKQNKDVCNTLINLSAMCRQQKKYTSALTALNEVNEIFQVTHDTAIEGYYYLNKGVVLETMGNIDSAAYCYRKAYDIWKLLGKESEVYKATFNLGYIAEEKKDYNEALRYYHLSEAAARKYGSTKEIAHVCGTMAEAYAAINDFKNAYTYLYEYATLNDSLSKSDFNSYVVKLDKQFENEKNRETIQAQELKLQKQRGTILFVIIVLIVVIFATVAIFSYLTFNNRIKKKVDEAKTRFFSNVAHEIRTPLSMIQGPINVLQSKIDDPALVHQLSIAERNTQRLNDLINQMLAISKVDAAKYQLNEHIGNPIDFINELVLLYDAQAKEKHLAFSKQVEHYTQNTLFDSDALEKIIGNLVGNAIKYTPQGGAIGIEVSSEAYDEATGFIINVWDTGIGIAKKEHTQIFERFYRSEEHKEAGIKGIGIGLSLIKELVELMNGTIEVESEPGKGSVFTVKFSLKHPQKATAVTKETTEDQNTILLVEDDPDILNFNKLLLAERGFNVITAVNGNEALAIFAKQLPDLVITDLMMPDKGGIGLIKGMKSNPLTDHIPVIILSAKTSAESKTEGVVEGAQVYLSKPYHPEQLVALVNNQLQVIHKQIAHFRQQAGNEQKTIEERFSGTDPFTQKCYTIIHEHLDDAQLSVEMLAELMNINRSHFQRKIKALTGYSPSELIRIIRLENAKEMLLKKAGNITEIAYLTGFTSQSYFTKCFSDHFGYPPSQLPGK